MLSVSVTLSPNLSAALNNARDSTSPLARRSFDAVAVLSVQKCCVDTFQRYLQARPCRMLRTPLESPNQVIVLSCWAFEGVLQQR